VKHPASNGGKWIRPEKRKAIYVRDGLQCVYCGADVEETRLTLDHLLPFELGGGNGASNLVTACASCNCAKGKKTLRQFLSYLRGCSIDTSGLSKRIRRTVLKPLRGYNSRK